MLKNLANPKRAIYMAAGATIGEALLLWGPIELGLTPELTYQWIVLVAGPLITGAIVGLGFYVMFHGHTNARKNAPAADS